MEKAIHRSEKKFKNLGRGKKDETTPEKPRSKLKIKELSRQQSFSFLVGPKEHSSNKPKQDKVKELEIGKNEMDEGSNELQSFLANQNSE